MRATSLWSRHVRADGQLISLGSRGLSVFLEHLLSHRKSIIVCFKPSPGKIAQNLIFKVVNSSYIFSFCLSFKFNKQTFVLLGGSSFDSSLLSFNVEGLETGKHGVFQRMEKVCRL